MEARAVDIPDEPIFVLCQDLFPDDEVTKELFDVIRSSKMVDEGCPNDDVHPINSNDEGA